MSDTKQENLTLTVTTSEAPEPIPVGVYKAKLKEIEERSGEHGPYLLLNFEITEGAHIGTERSTIASKKLNTKSKLYGVVAALLASEPQKSESVDLQNLIGKECRIMVKNKQGDTNGWQTISEVLPAE